MKKLLACVLALAMVLTMVAVLASCGAKDQPKETTKETTAEQGGKETETEKEAETPKETAKETEKETPKETKKETHTKKETKNPTLENPTFDIVKLRQDTAIEIDGELDSVYYTSQPFELIAKDIDSDPDAITGAGLQGGANKKELKDDDFSDTFYFAFDETYMYICEVRVDKTPNYPANTFRMPYAGDGSLIWFMNYGKNFYDPQCGIQWNAAVNLDDPESEEYSTEPVFGLFQKTNEGASVKKDWECKKEQYTDYYILEVKIPLADLGFTAEDVEANHIGFTLCTVDVVSDEFDGDPSGNKLWDYGYQLQYTGCTKWVKSPIGVCKEEPDPSIAAANAAMKTIIGDGFGTSFSGTVLAQANIDPAIDISKATKVKITWKLLGDYDLSSVTNDGDIELCAGGGCDELEIAWHTIQIKGLGISKEGEEATMELTLNINDLAAAGMKWTATGPAGAHAGAELNEDVLKNINFFRVYLGGGIAIPITITAVVFE